jgi:Protein of unknown function (DUF3352)
MWGARRRSAPLAVAALLVAALAGCGGKHHASIAHPEAEALAWFPRDAGVVGLVATDPERGQLKALDDLVHRFPGASIALGRLSDSLRQAGLDYQQDVRPLLGDEAAFGQAGSGTNAPVVLVWPVKDANKLRDVLDRRAKRSGGRRAGTYRGAQLYVDASGNAFADRGGVLVVGDTLPIVRRAIDRRAAGHGMTPAAFARSLGPLPRDALVRVTGNLATLLAGPGSATARKVPWVAALRRYGLAVRAAGGGLTGSLRADTSQGNLADGDVPFATGPQAPPVVPGAPVSVGIRDPSHLVDFAERAAEAIDPARFAAFQLAETALRLRARVDLEGDVVQQLQGNAALATDLSTFRFRSDLADPKAMVQTLQRLAPIMPAFLSGAGIPDVTVRQLAPDAWQLIRGGRPLATYAVASARLVAGNAPLAALRAFATAPARPVPGARGSLATATPGASLASALSNTLGLGSAGALVLGRLGDVRGWLTSDVSGLGGRLTVAIR